MGFRTCEVCGNQFETNSRKRKYCFSEECQKQKKIIQQKRKEQSYLTHYGVTNPLKSQEIKDRIKQTCLDKYGFESANQSEIVKENKKKSFQERYGVDYTFQIPEIEKKIKESRSNQKFSKDIYRRIVETNKRNHNGIMAWNPESFKRKNGYYTSQMNISKESLEILENENKFLELVKSLEFKDRTVRNISKLLDVSYSTVLRRINNYNIKDKVSFNFYVSSYELELREMFKEYKQEHNYRYDNKEIDLYFPEYKFGVEFNGNYYHDKNEYLKDIMNNTENSRERQKEKLFESIGIKIIQIWEDDWKKNKQKEINKIKEVLSV